MSNNIVDLEARLKARLEEALNEIGEAYNDLEEQVHSLTEAKLVERLDKLEELSQINTGAGDQRNEASVSKNGAPDSAQGTSENSLSLDSIARTVKSLESDVNAIITSKATEISSQLNKHQQKLSKLDKRTRTTEAVLQTQGELGQSLRDLIARLQRVEDRARASNEGNSIASLSATELAEALLERLKTGQVVQEAVAAQLRSATAGSNDHRLPGRHLHTPPTDLENSGATTKATGGTEPRLREETTARTTRARQTPPAQPSYLPAEEMVEQSSPEMTQQTRSSRKRPASDEELAEQIEEAHQVNKLDLSATRRSLKRSRESIDSRRPPRKRAKIVEVEQQEEAGAEAPEDDDNDDEITESTPLTPRRTSRAPKPTSKLESFKTWVEVKAERRQEKETLENKRRDSRKQRKSKGGAKRFSV